VPERPLLRVRRRRPGPGTQGQRQAGRDNPEGGSDLVRANRYTDDKDVVEGGLGNDKIYDNDTRDTANGGQGNSDACYVDARSEAGRGCGKVIVR
jgi:hypothetical protein